MSQASEVPAYDVLKALARHELPLTKYAHRPRATTGLNSNFVVDVLTTHNGGIYHDDHEALEALNLVVQALGQTLTVQVIEWMKDSG